MQSEGMGTMGQPMLSAVVGGVQSRRRKQEATLEGIALVTARNVRRRVLGTSYARQRVGGMPALTANGRA